jgi:opacity protein-like surface antigen
MKKWSILAVLVMVLCFCTSSYAADAAGHSWYLGIGGSWALENIDTDDLEDEFDPIDVDFDDGYGFQAKVGYHLNDTFSLGLVFDYITGFESDEDISVTESIDIYGEVFTGSASAEVELEVDVWTLMLEGKASMSGTLSPYAVLGVGIMQADADADLSVSATLLGETLSVSESASEDDTIACGKVGLGVDWWATPDVTIGLEGNYVFGFGDADFDDLEVGTDYFTFVLGAAIHF